MNLVDLSFPQERVCCFFCQKSLFEDGKYKDLQICTSTGVAILTCPDHATDGDRLVAALNAWKFTQSNPKDLNYGDEEKKEA